MKDIVTITIAIETLTMLSIMPKEVKKAVRFKVIEKEVPPPKKLRSAMETFEINQCHFCQLMSEGRLYDRMQDSYRYRTENEFRECPWSLKIFKHRSLGIHSSMTSELKYHQMRWNRTIENRFPEVLYASTMPSLNELESLKSHVLMPRISAKSIRFLSSSHEMRKEKKRKYNMEQI